MHLQRSAIIIICSAYVLLSSSSTSHTTLAFGIQNQLSPKSKTSALLLPSTHHHYTNLIHTTTTTTALNMSGKDIDGKAIAAAVRAELTEKLASITKDTKPGLAVMLVGERKDSQTYVRMKQKACADCGMDSFLSKYEDVDAVTEEILLKQIKEWNEDPKVHGILVQLPLPPKINEATILKAVLPEKDVDGLHPANTASLFNTATHAGNEKLNWKDFTTIPFHIPCTPQGCIELLDRIGMDIEGKNAVVIGRSNLVGLPVAMLLCHRNATVTIVHSRTKNTENVVKQADIVVAAVGRAHMVPKSWLKPGCTVIDVGINSVDAPDTKRGYRLVGDVNYAEAKEVVEWITPVPGGVGPMTIAMLLRNTWNSWRRATGAD